MELVMGFIFFMIHYTFVYADYQGDALYAFKNAIDDDPKGALSSWDNSLVDPSTWSHVEWNNMGVERVDLGYCELTGRLVPELGNLDKLQYLELNNNELIGQIPAEFGNLTDLMNLDLYGNSLTGPIPQELSNLKNLKFFRLNNNNLSGPVPDVLADHLKDILNKDTTTVVDLSGNPNLCGAFTDKPYC